MPHPLTNIEIINYYQDESKFKHVYSGNNLRNTLKESGYIVNLDEYKSMETHWIALHVNVNNVANFNSCDVENGSKEVNQELLATKVT